VCLRVSLEKDVGKSVAMLRAGSTRIFGSKIFPLAGC
jgi:hypothetical protein